MAVNLLEILAECGLSQLSEEDQKDLASHLQTVLEQQVGEKLAPLLSKGQLEAFERAMVDSNDEAALAVLREAVPDYEKYVREQVELLKGELRARRQEILKTVGIGGTLGGEDDEDDYV